VFQGSLPNIGPGALKVREDPNQRASKDVPHLNAATDFYKKFALDCSGQQVAVDLFLLGSQYMDIASLCKVYFLLKQIFFFRIQINEFLPFLI
jgi:protein transport protein SEC24